MNRTPAVGPTGLLTTSSGLQALTTPAARQSVESCKSLRIGAPLEVLFRRPASMAAGADWYPRYPRARLVFRSPLTRRWLGSRYPRPPQSPPLPVQPSDSLKSAA